MALLVNEKKEEGNGGREDGRKMDIRKLRSITVASSLWP